MDSVDISTAKEALQNREGTLLKLIGSWSKNDPAPNTIPSLDKWAESHEVDHAIWANIPPKWNGNKRTPTEQEVVDYLKELTGSARTNAEEYIRKAPKQIGTLYRRKIEAELGWKPE